MPAFNAGKIRPVLISSREVLPIIEGGKGIAVTNSNTAGAFAAAGAVGTFSGVNPQRFDEHGHLIPYVYHGTTRRERHEELIAQSSSAGIQQAKIAPMSWPAAWGASTPTSCGRWVAAERIITEVLEQGKGIINGITCGAGMPYRLSDIAARFNVYYYPIISSARAFNALWKRAYSKAASLLGGVVYEDPWLAGGHNGLSNSEDPTKPEDPFPRVLALRKLMREFGLHDTPIIMAGGVWWLEEWQDWIDNPELGPMAFQFGTRPLLTQESPIGDAWKERLRTLQEGDVFLNRFSPTGFYSSAVNNGFIQELRERNERQVAYTTEAIGEHVAEFGVGPRKRIVYLTPADLERARGWEAQGFTEALRTPDSTLIFVTPEKAKRDPGGPGRLHGLPQPVPLFQLGAAGAGLQHRQAADPRSFCIQKTLQDIAHESDERRRWNAT